MTRITTFFFIFHTLFCYSQADSYGIEFPKNMAKECGECLTILRTMPPDVTFGFQVKGNEIFFIMTDVRWYDQLFNKNSDGLAVDILLKSQYPCNSKNTFTNSQVNKGKLLPPVFYKEMKKNAMVTNTGEVMIKAGDLPSKYEEEDFELNLLIIKDKKLCYYNNFYDLPRAKWELLGMGLYKDSLPAEKTTVKNMPGGNREYFEMLDKTIKFVIPFEKNKFEYSQEDIKPIYDSLRLTDFNINKINIRAYSSVEGSTERNITLQNKRAESIVKALQSYQSLTIGTEISASENWVEFLNDIAGTPHEFLSKLSKEEIKTRLEKEGLSKELEPILKNHRKAVLIFDLQKKTKYSESDSITIRSFYQKSLMEKNIEEALQLQEIIFSKIRNHQLPDSFLNSVEIPREVEYGSLLKNNTVFLYEQNESDFYSAIIAFKSLQDLLPNDPHIKYNLCVLKLKSWLFGELLSDPVELKSEILALEKTGINKILIKRLLINYHIIFSEYLIYKKEYAEKDKSIKYIYDNYTYLNLSGKDVLQLAKYFSGYSKYDWAEKMLTPYVKKIDVDEEVLFYYLNLTIIKPENTKKTTYRTIMLNAINADKKRFCTMFEPFGKGGINFQLLGDTYLKSTYCENCSN